METEAYFKETLQAGEALFDMVCLLQQASLDVFLATVLVKKNKVDQEVSPYWDCFQNIFSHDYLTLRLPIVELVILTDFYLTLWSVFLSWLVTACLNFYSCSTSYCPHPWGDRHLKPWMLFSFFFFVFSPWVPRLCSLVYVPIFSWDFLSNTMTLTIILVLAYFHPDLWGFEVLKDTTKIEVIKMHVCLIGAVTMSYSHSFQMLFVDFSLCATFILLWSVRCS